MSKIRCQMFTLLLISSRCFLINIVIAVHTLPPPLIIANRNSILSLHNLSPLNDDGYHGYKLCTPSMIMTSISPQYVPLIDDGPYGSTLYPHSIVMSPMSPHSAPLNDDGLHGYLQSVPLIDDFSYGYTICPTKL